MKSSNDSALEALFWFFGIFLVTYFLWYVGGGPARWDAKFKKMDEKKYPIFIKDPIDLNK